MSAPRRACVLVESHYENLELWYPYWRLRELGFDVDLGRPPSRKKPTARKKAIRALRTHRSARRLERKYAILVAPGGHARRTSCGAIRRFCASSKKLHDEGGIVASICHWAVGADLGEDSSRQESHLRRAIKDDVRETPAHSTFE
jgi:protease I